MNSEKEFKNKLGEKLSQKEFQFDEANWDEARKLIDASREEKKRRVLPFFLFGLLFIGAGSLAFYFLNSSSVTNKIYAKKSPGSDKLIATNTIPLIEKPVNINPAKENNSEIKKTITSGNKPPKAVKQFKNINSGINAESKAVAKSGAKTKQPVSQNNFRAKENPVRVKQQKQNYFVPAIAKETHKKQEPVSVTEARAESKPTTDDKTDLTATEKKETKDIVENKPETLQSENKNELPVNTNTLINLPVADAKSLTTLAGDTIKENLTRPPTHFISFEAGANYLFGWKNPGKRDANGFNPVVGLNYSNLVSKKVTLSFGIYYTMVRNLSYSNVTVKTTRYNFGEQSDIMVFTPTTLHYLVAPLRLSYAVNQKNSVGLGCNIGYLFNVGSNVEFYSEQGNQKSASVNLKTLGYTQGFKTINTQLSLFYRRSLSKDLWLHAEFMYGLTDVKDNTFFNSAVHERNTGLKITLIYNLFKK